MNTFSQRERMEQFLLKIKIRKILLATRVVLFLLLVVHGVESNPGPRKRGTRARDRLPKQLSDSRSGNEDWSKSSDGSNNTEIKQQRNVTIILQDVTVSPKLHKPETMSMHPSGTQFQLPAEPQYQPTCQAQYHTTSQTQSQPSSQVQSQSLSQPQHPSQILSQPPFLTQFQLPSVELQPRNMLTLASPVRDNVDISVLQNIMSQLKDNNDMLQRIVKDQKDTKSELKHLNEMLQRVVKNQGDTSVLLNRGIEELTKKVDRLESRLQNLDGENEQLETHLRNGNSVLHDVVKKEEKRDKVSISEDNFARSYNQHVYKAEKQGCTTKSNNCCYSKGSMESIKIEGTECYFDEIVLKDELNPTDYMKSFIVEVIKATSFHQNTSRKCWDTKETLADSMKPSARTKDDFIDYLYRDFLPQIKQHVITLPTKRIPPRDFNVRVTPVSGVQKNELSRILFCRRCGFVKHLVIEVLDTNTDVSNSRSCLKERSSRKLSSMSSCVSSEDYSPKLIRKDFMLAQEQSASAIARSADNSSSLFRRHLSKASNSGEILITKREQSLNKIDIIGGMLVARNNKSHQSSRLVKFRTDRIRMFVRRLSNGRMVHNSSNELCALLLCPCCGTLLDDRIMWLVPMSENYKVSVHKVSQATGILSRRDAQGSKNFNDASCRGIENISVAKRDITNSGRKQSFGFEHVVIYNRNRKAYNKVSERQPVERRNPRHVGMNAYIPFAPEHLEKEPDAPLEGSLKPKIDVPGRLNHHSAQKILPLDADKQNNGHASVTRSLHANTVVQNVNPASTREQHESEQVSKTDQFSHTNGELTINQAVQNNDYSLVPEMINGASSFEFNHPEYKSANQIYDPLPIQKMVDTSAQRDRFSSAPKNLDCERPVRMNDIVTRTEAQDIDLTVKRDNTLSLHDKYDSSRTIQMNAPSFLSESQNNQAAPQMGDLSRREISHPSLNFLDKRVGSDAADHKKQFSFTFMEPDSKSSILMNELHTQIQVDSSASIWPNDSLYISDELKVYLGTAKDEGISNHLCEVVLLASNVVEQSNVRNVIAEKLHCDSAVDKANSSTTLEQLDFVSGTHTKNQLPSQKEPDTDLNFQIEKRSPVQEQEGEPSFPRMHSENKPFIQRMDDPSSRTMTTNEFAFLRTNSPRTKDNLTNEPDTKSDNPSSASELLEKHMSVFRDGSTSVAAETLKSESTFQRKDMSLVPGHIGSDLAIQNNEVMSLAEQVESKAVVYKKDRPEVLSVFQNRTYIPPLQQSECKQTVKRSELSPTSKMPSSVPAKWKHCPTTEPISGVGDYSSPPQIPPDSAVQALLEHGYHQHTVRDAYDKMHQSCRRGCLRAADMMEAILDMEQKEKEIGAHIPKLESENGSETRTLPAKRGHERACVNSGKAKKGPDILPDFQGCRSCCTTLTMLVFLMCGHMMKACPRCA